jgi:hypothetical protein
MECPSMTVVATDQPRRTSLRVANGGVVSPSVHVSDAYWGYIIASPLADRRWAEVGQTASWIAGMAFLIAAIGLWLLPGASVASDVMAMKFGLSTVLGGIASVLIYYASRGVRTEIQVDTKLGEIREIVRNSAGRTSLISKLRFDMIGGVFLDRTNADRGETALLLRFLNTPKVMLVAVGPTEHLEQLRNRLGRDLLAVTKRQEQDIR